MVLRPLAVIWKECGKKMKKKLFNTYTCFILGLVLVTGATFVKVPCPACEGTGTIPGVTGIDIKGIEAELINHHELGMDCGWDYERFTYDVKLTLENRTQSDSYGIIMVTFHDPDDSYQIMVEIDDDELYVDVAGATLASNPVFVELPGGATEVIEKRMLFEGVTLEFFGGREHQIEANIASNYNCPFHGGDASVPFPEWLRLR